MGLMKFTTWMLAEAKFKVKVHGSENSEVIDAKDKDAAIAQIRLRGEIPTEVDPHVPSPKDNLDSDQDGTKNSSDPTPTDVPDPTKTSVPKPAEAAGIRRREARQRAGRSGFKIQGRSSAIGMTDPSKGVGVFKNAVGAGDVVDFIGAKGPGEVPKAAAGRAKQSDTIARAKRQKQIRKEREAEENAKQEEIEKAEARKSKIKTKARTQEVHPKSGGGNVPTDMGGTQKLSDKTKAAFGSSAVQRRSEERKKTAAATTATVESLETTIKTMLGEKNDI